MYTKENIIKESINLFSVKGYDAVSIRDIAKTVGIKGSSIYNHFESKEDLFNYILSNCSNYIEHSLRTLTKRNTFKENIDNISDNLFLEESMQLFNFLLKDDYSVKLRRILTIEQFKNKKASELFNNLFIDNILNIQRDLFKELIDEKIFINIDPYILALKFYSPVFLLFYKDKNLSNQDITILQQHILDFKHYYSMRG
ncbi:MAG: TetR/AcrR family transcriptional regulator [Clostridium butyricum]|nr:TetR/AcrR family transcriptional regulator [Clostridium butyricum]